MRSRKCIGLCDAFWQSLNRDWSRPRCRLFATRSFSWCPFSLREVADGHAAIPDCSRRGSRGPRSGAPPASCSTRGNKLYMTGGLCIAVGSSITATEAAQYVSIKYTERLAEAGIEPVTVAGSTIAGCWSPSATSRRPRPRSTTTPRWTNQLWRRDSNETACGKPGAVQAFCQRDTGAACVTRTAYWPSTAKLCVLAK
jgi:hypothetical protein